VILTIQREGEAPRQVEIDRPEAFLGKHAGCEVVLADAKVSRRHVRLTVEAGRVYVEDLGSTNGSTLGGRPLVGRAELPPGEDLGIGPFVVQLAAASPAPTAKPPVSEGLELGPLGPLFADETISEIMVNGPNEIFVERAGKLQLVGGRFDSEHSLVQLIEAMAADVGREIDPRAPMLDARLRDGSRLNAILPPLALRGPCLTVRRFPQHRFSADQLVSVGALSPPMAEFLRSAVMGRLSMLISGGTGSGKTTLLSALCAFIGPDERIITIEDAAELRLPQRHVVPLEARPPDPDGKGAVTIRDLVRNALRMRPERIVVGEVRGGEALDMLQAMNTGHEGSLSTIHANSPREAITRLETLVLFAGTELPAKAIREQVVSAIRLIVQTSRMQDGSRRVTSVSELTGLEGEQFTMGEIFRLDGVGKDAAFEATGYVPKSRELLLDRKVPVDNKWFQP
jgi:pilus assembly protein CpaF